jgi:hypothetical protein
MPRSLEANAILGQVMTLYNDINAAVLEERVVLPGDCRLRPQVLDNLEDSAPLARWSRGFLVGHEWLEELWNVELSGDLDEELGVVLMTLSFFSSRNLAEGEFNLSTQHHKRSEALWVCVGRGCPGVRRTSSGSDGAVASR